MADCVAGDSGNTVGGRSVHSAVCISQNVAAYPEAGRRPVVSGNDAAGIPGNV